MKLLFASDSFKGTLSSEQIIRLLTDSANRIFPGCETVGVPIADGGEGTVDAVIAVTKGCLRTVKVHGPLMELSLIHIWVSIAESGSRIVIFAIGFSPVFFFV